MEAVCSLPDYGERGWHGSRKQVMKEFGGLNCSYYMDPQPKGLFEWHLFEYELSSWTDCALYNIGAQASGCLEEEWEGQGIDRPIYCIIAASNCIYLQTYPRLRGKTCFQAL